MAKSLTNLQSQVRQNLGNPPTGVIADSRLTNRINDSYREITTRYRHPELETTETLTTADGTSTASPASDYWFTQAIRDETNDRLLRQKSLSWILAQDTDSKGQPYYYTRRGSTLLLYPTPDGVYSLTHYYVAEPTALSAGGDTTVFDHLAWDEIIEWGATWRLHQEEGELDKMVHARNIWRTLINSMPETETLDRESSTQIIGPLIDNPTPGYREGVSE